MRIGDAFRDEDPVARIEKDIDNQRIKRLSNPSRRPALDGLDVFRRCGATRFNSEPPQQDAVTEKLDQAIDAKCFQ